MEGILLPGDRVDLLFSTDVVGEQEGAGGKVSIYAIQDLEVLQIIYQPPPAPQEGQEGEPAPDPATLVPKTLILAIEPQDSVVLKYAVDSEAPINLALRAVDNRRVFEVDAATINTIADRYRFISPRPLR
jgi:Flp pilus assembly protein CpaB